MPGLADIPFPPRRLRRCRGYLRLALHAVLLVVVGFFAQIFWLAGSGTIRLLWFGESTPARVREVLESPGKHGPFHEVEVTYPVDDVGDVVTVIYAPRRPRRSVLYEYAEYEFAAEPIPA
jgi:hypothetical protein